MLSAVTPLGGGILNIPKEENIIYRGILNWTSQFAREKCSYYSIVTIANYH